MSEVKKPREWRLLDAGLNQNINGLKQEFRIAMYQENFGLIEGVTIPVIEKSAFDKAIEALKEADKLIEDDNFFGQGVEITDFIQWKRELRELFKELGCES